MFLIGDVHGKWSRYHEIIAAFPESVQLGDFGIGFRSTPKSWDMNHRFIRGNHDAPAQCKRHKNFLGDWGMYKGMFYVSGAMSIDRDTRIPELSWWEDEEINQKYHMAILEQYHKEKPRIVIAHDCPAFIKQYIPYNDGNVRDKLGYANWTSNMLMQQMVEIHKPEFWYHGHYHCSYKQKVKGVTYIGLDELEVAHVED